MKIIIAKNIGFCSGVKRAISVTEQALKEKTKPVQFLGSLVHNENIIDKFLKRGVILKKNLKEIKPGILIIQAHGFSPFPKKFDEKILIRDATCPLVKKVQMLANSLWKNSYQVIIIGDKNHSETKGIKGYTKNKAVIVENKEQAKNLPKFKRVAVVTQTTQNLNNVNEILKVLKRRHKKIKYFNTLCLEVQKRQKETRVIAEKTDGMLVIGSKTSANTKGLYQISKNSGKPVWWVNSLDELKKQNIKDAIVLGVVSGTSADNAEVEKIKNYLKRARQANG